MLQHLALAIALLAASQTHSHRIVAESTHHRPMPTVLEIVERSIEAVGGRSVWLKIKSQYGVGTIELQGTSIAGKFEVYANATNQSLVVMKMDRGIEIKTGFDGQRSWSQTLPNPAQYDPPTKQAASKRDADFYKYLHFKKHFPNAKVTGIQEVDGEKAYRVEAFPVGEKLPERLYFNVETGLLVLRDISRVNAEGKIVPDMIYYSDYRSVDGIKIAFSLRMIQGDTTIITKQTSLKNNVPMDNALFRLPVSQ